MAAPASTLANKATAKALFQTGASIRDVAKQLGVSPYTAWAFKHSSEELDPTLVQSVSKTISDNMLLSANMAVQVFQDQCIDGKLADETPLAVAKAAAVLLNSAANYAALSGAKDLAKGLMDEYGISAAHQVTVTQSVTVTTPQPVVSSSTLVDITPTPTVQVIDSIESVQ